MSESSSTNIDEVKQKVSLLQDELKAKALNLVHSVMPAKVIQLSEMYKVSSSEFL